MLIKLCL